MRALTTAIALALTLAACEMSSAAPDAAPIDLGGGAEDGFAEYSSECDDLYEWEFAREDGTLERHRKTYATFKIAEGLRNGWVAAEAQILLCDHVRDSGCPPDSEECLEALPPAPDCEARIGAEVVGSRLRVLCSESVALIAPSDSAKENRRRVGSGYRFARVRIQR